MTLFTQALASLDLSDEKQRAIRDYIKGTHEKSSVWRTLTAHRSKDQILEVVEFVSPRRPSSAIPRFGVVTWDLATAAVRWQQGHLTRGQAMKRFNAMKAGATIDLNDEVEIRINIQGRGQGEPPCTPL